MITLEKAIEIKLQWRKDNYPPPLADQMNADMLSIEAMKRIRRQRSLTIPIPQPPLPGETMV